MPRDAPCAIGELRHKVTLASRNDLTDPNSSNLLENYTRIADVWAKITPSKAEAIIGGEDVETPITHTIIIRWQPYEYVGIFDTIIRYINLPNTERRAELFRIRDIEEWEGRFRYLIIDAELEKFSA